MIDQKIKERFPDLDVRFEEVEGLTIKRASDTLEAFKSQVIGEIKVTYALETLKDDPQMRLYRDFFWKIGIDPTKIRPASEPHQADPAGQADTADQHRRGCIQPRLDKEWRAARGLRFQNAEG